MSFQPKDPSQDGHKKNNESRPQAHGIQPRQMGRRMGRSMNRFESRYGRGTSSQSQVSESKSIENAKPEAITVPEESRLSEIQQLPPERVIPELQESVGKGGVNRKEDVEIVRYYLLELGLLTETDTIPQEAGTLLEEAQLPRLIAAIYAFQEEVLHWPKADANIGGPASKTLEALKSTTAEQAQFQREKYPAIKAKREAYAADKAKADVEVKDEEAKKEQESERAEQSIKERATKIINAHPYVTLLAAKVKDYILREPALVIALFNELSSLEKRNVSVDLINLLADSELDKIENKILLQFSDLLASDFGANMVASNLFEPLNRIQKALSNENNFVIKSGILTIAAEGNDQQTKYVHWPGNAASGVTLGKGYDCGNRRTDYIKVELEEAGFSEDKAELLSNAAGLKGAKAKEWIKKNKSEVGEIPKMVQYKLFSLEFQNQANSAKEIATAKEKKKSNINAYSRELKHNKPEGTFRMTNEEWKGMHPAIKELIVDLKYRGDYGWNRVEWVNSIVKDKEKTDLEKLKALKDLIGGEEMKPYTGKVPRRTRLRVSYLDMVIQAIENGKTVKLEEFKSTDKGEEVDDFLAYDKERINQKRIKEKVGKDCPNKKEDVEKVQSFLSEKGYTLEKTGQWDDASQEALDQFQQQLVDDKILKEVYKDGEIDINGTTFKNLVKP